MQKCFSFCGLRPSGSLPGSAPEPRWGLPSLRPLTDLFIGCLSPSESWGAGLIAGATACTVFGRPFVKRLALCYRTVVCPVCLSVLSCLSVRNVGVLWPNGWIDQDETHHAGRPWPGHIVLYGPSCPSPKRERSLPNFRPMSIVAKQLDASRCHLVWR